MKLLVQADDYGITEGVSAGIIRTIENGIVRNTGLFANMECAPKVVEWIRPYLDEICFGIDLNLSAGRPCSEPERVKSLIQEDDSFMTSKMHKELEESRPMKYDEILYEYIQQIERYKQLVGKLPGYIHGHSYRNKDTDLAMEECSRQYNIPVSWKILKERNVKQNPISWYPILKTGVSIMEVDTIHYFCDDVNGYLNSEISAINTHCGYVDADLFKVSSYTLLRVKDLEAMTSQEVKSWIEKNNIELITYRDL